MDKKIRLLCAEGDRASMAEVIEQLGKKGLRAADLGAGENKKELILAVLSEHFYADEALMDRLLSLIASGGADILPLQLDGAEIPDVIKNPLYSRNIISVPGRDAALIAERILAALPQKKSRLPLILSVAGVLILALAGFLIWRSTRSTDNKPSEGPEPVSIGYALPEGITEEDLEDIRCVVIIGEHLKAIHSKEWEESLSPFTSSSIQRDVIYQFGVEDYVSEEQRDWYWTEDGTKASMKSYDLRFLSLMPNLQELDMALADVTEVPDLSGLPRLNTVRVYECTFEDTRWLASSNAMNMFIRSHVDCTPLSESKHLTYLALVAFGDAGTDFSALSPPNLSSLDLSFAYPGETDLSGLRDCRRLHSLNLAQASVRDLSFLENCTMLESLNINVLLQLEDISALEGLKSLRELDIWFCENLTDLSPISGCTGLRRFTYNTWMSYMRLDGAFLEPLVNLESLELQNIYMDNLDFLRALAEHRVKIDFSVTGNIGDYSGLEAFRSYGELSIDPSDNRPAEQIMPYLNEATINNLHLRRFSNMDLSLLPKVVSSLELDRCGLKDLSSFPEGYMAPDIYLNKCSKLESLNGLQNLSRFGKNGSGTLSVYACPRLMDWSAIDGMNLYSLEINGGFSLPDFSTLTLKNLRINSVADIENLDFLNAMDNSKPCSFELVNLEAVTNLKPVFRFKGEHIGVPPQLAEQAADLVKSGNFWDYYVIYPDSGWELTEAEIQLESLEELETLPPSLLRHVTSVTLVGDRIMDRENGYYWLDYGITDRQGNPALMITNSMTGEETRVEPGTLSDLTIFSELTGLRELRLVGQQLTDLNGIQVFSELEVFEVTQCPKLSDFSALFTLQNLRELNLSDTNIDSIQGIQNLTELRYLDISRTKVSDLTPLAQGDYSRACEEGGFGFDANELAFSEEDFQALGTIPRFSNLAFTDADPSVWIPALANSEINWFGGSGDFQSDEDLAAFVADHPELRGLWLGWAENITDLTPLLSLEHLESVTVSSEMKEAVASLEGQTYTFDFDAY